MAVGFEKAGWDLGNICLGTKNSFQILMISYASSFLRIIYFISSNVRPAQI